jgi:hypothetical protein
MAQPAKCPDWRQALRQEFRLFLAFHMVLYCAAQASAGAYPKILLLLGIKFGMRSFS